MSYYERNRTVILAKMKAKRLAAPDKARRAVQTWRAKHPARARAIAAASVRRHRRERTAYTRRWRADHPALYFAQQQRAHTAQRARRATEGHFTLAMAP